MTKEQKRLVEEQFAIDYNCASERMWELGVNSFVEGKDYGQAALSVLVKEVQKRGKVPYAGTALSHNASQNIFLRAGLVPSFCELRSVKID